MNEQAKTSEDGHARRKRRHGFWLGLLAGGVGGALVAGALMTTATVSAAAKMFHRGGHHRFTDPEAAREHAQFAARFVLERVDASDSQQATVERIVGDTVKSLVPLAEQHRANKDAWHEELGREVIDPDAIERLRAAEIQLADEASKELSAALTELAQTLTPEQRAELMELGERFRH